MKAWKEKCAEQCVSLDKALALAGHVRALGENPHVRHWVKAEDMAELEETMGAIEKKRKRIGSGEFHIAVVGTEKAGKSSFINAWLSCDLLPNRPKRCTFTTTRLHSVESVEKQKLEVFPKTREDWNALLRTLEDEAKGTDTTAANAQEDLKTIAENKEELDNLVGKDKLTFSFTELDEVRDKLEKYAADSRYAHAIRQVNLYTRELAKMEGIMFYDVPGLNSGLRKHIQETKDMLEDSDAVIIVKDLIKPSIDGADKEIFRYIKQGDLSIEVKDKVFVFASRLDMHLTREGLLGNFADLKKDCAEYHINEDKIIVGAAPAHLHLKGRLRDVAYIDDIPQLKQKLQLLCDLPNTEDETLFQAIGVNAIQQRVQRYLETDRLHILENSCAKLENTVRSIAHTVYDAVRPHVSENPEALARQHEDDLRYAFRQWCKTRWQQILSKMGDPSKACEEIQQHNDTLKKDYAAMIEQKMAEFILKSEEERPQYFAALRNKYGVQPGHFNTDWRRNKLYPELTKLVQNVGLSLSADLYQALNQYMEKLGHEFYDLVPVKEELLKAHEVKSEEAYSLWLKSSLSALYLRFARPLVDALIPFPLENRHNITVLPADLQSISHYYALSENAQPEYKQLKSFITYGMTMFTDPAVRKRLCLDSNQIKDNIVTTLGEKAASTVNNAAAGAGSLVGGALAGPVGAAIGSVAGEMLAGKGVQAVTNVLSTAGSQQNDQAQEQPDALTETQIEALLESVIREVNADIAALKEYLLHALFDSSGIVAFAHQEYLLLRSSFIDSETYFLSKLEGFYGRRDPALLMHLPEHLQVFECDLRVAEQLHQLGLALRTA